MKKLAEVAAALFLIGSCAHADPVYVDRCSGTYLGNGIVMTAGHCFLLLGRTVVTVWKDKPKNEGDETGGYKATLMVVDEVNDIAFARLDKEIYEHKKPDESSQWKERDLVDGVPWGASTLSCRDLHLNDEISMTGWPAGFKMTTKGYVSSEAQKFDNWPVGNFVVMGGFYGSSGSGVVAKDGRVVAVLTGTIPNSELHYVVPVKAICDVIPRSLTVE